LVTLSATYVGHSVASNQLCDLIFHAVLCQLINALTHQQGNFLNLLLTNIQDKIEDVEIHLDPHLHSDHFNITFSVYTKVNGTAY